jgi:hypothetical protein
MFRFPLLPRTAATNGKLLTRDEKERLCEVILLPNQNVQMNQKKQFL